MAEELVTLWRYRDLPEALVAKSKLDSDGVGSFLADFEIVRVDWFWSNAVGGVKLQVPDDEAEHARALLSEEIPTGFTAEEAGEAYQQPECPNCQSLDVAFQPWHRHIALLFLGFAVLYKTFAALPIFIPRKSWKCEDCRHEWDAPYD